MKRIITVIIIIVVVVSVILAGAWLLSRRTAQKNGTAALSFKQFLTGDTTGVRPSASGDGSLGSVFTNPDGTAGTDGTLGTTDDTPLSVAVSDFTNDSSLNPSGDFSGILDPTLTLGNGNPIDTLVTGGIKPPTDTTTTVTGASLIVATGCTNADKNITFTPEELTRLRGLQNRFYAVATTLHTDADAAAELANYTNFDLKLKNLAELNAYCATNLSRIPDATLKKAVPTPFWHELSRDSLWGFFSGQGSMDGRFAGGDVTKAQRVVETALRLNLW